MYPKANSAFSLPTGKKLAGLGGIDWKTLGSVASGAAAAGGTALAAGSRWLKGMAGSLGGGMVRGQPGALY